ncbi:hypothetical protein J3D55_002234 [Chryseobacterium ginsenosidimutans]|nr:hypothetical protein [Chryseobacterium ginsenosidimutans]
MELTEYYSISSRLYFDSTILFYQKLGFEVVHEISTFQSTDMIYYILFILKKLYKDKIYYFFLKNLK